jgi:predicted esterase YcpF (UPF0227 family)
MNSKMKILYIHGFGSDFDPTGRKLSALSTIGEVAGINLDYTDPQCVFTSLNHFITADDFDVIVGTSLGGYLAGVLGTRREIPFVSINPAIDPHITLRKYLGTHLGYTGKEYTLTEEVVRAYAEDKFEAIAPKGRGLVLLDMGDDVLDSTETLARLSPSIQVVTFPGGSHRFDHIMESLDLIKKHAHFLL